MSSESDDELPQLPPASADAGGTDPRETTATTTVPYFSSPSNKIFLSRKTSTRIGLACQMPPQDIVLEGKGIEEEHCIVEWPGAGAAVADGVEVASVRLHPIGKIKLCFHYHYLLAWIGGTSFNRHRSGNTDAVRQNLMWSAHTHVT